MGHYGMKTAAKRVSLLALASAFVIGISACGSGDTSSSSTTIQDDLIYKAIVWCDTDGDDRLTTETTGTTGTDGSVDFTCTGDGQIIAQGYYKDETDYSQNVTVDGEVLSAFSGSLSAPAGYTYVTPVSTIVNAIGGVVSVDETTVKAALGITGNDDLSTLNINDTSNSTALEVKKAALVIQQLVLDSTNALQGASGKSNITPASFMSVAKQMATAINGLGADESLISSTGEFNTTVVENVVSTAIIAAAENDTAQFGSINAAAVALVVKEAVAVNAKAIAEAQDAYNADINSDAAKTNAINVTKQTQVGASVQIQLTMNAIKGYLKKEYTKDVISLVNAVASSLKASVASQEEIGLISTNMSELFEVIKAQVKESVIKVAVSSLSDDDIVSIGASSANDLNTELETAVTGISTDLTVAKAADDLTPEVSDYEVLVSSAHTPNTIPLIAYDPDGDSLEYTIVSFSLGGITESDISVNNSTGIATITGEITSGNIVFTVSDGTNTTANATVTVTVGNNTPDAYAQESSVVAKGALTGTLFGSDPDNVSLTYALASGPGAGTVVLVGDSFTYTSTGSTAGTDSFTFTVSDGVNTSDAQTVSLIILAPEGTNNAPVVDDLKVIVPYSEDGGSSITKQIVAEDPDSHSMTYAISDDGADCSDTTTCTLTTSNDSTVSLTTSSGEFTFTPSGTYYGVDTFSVTATDVLPTDTSMSVLTSTPATVTVFVTAASGTNTPYVANVEVSATAGTEISGYVVGSDLDFDTLTYSITGDDCAGNTCTLTTTNDSSVSLNQTTGKFTVTPSSTFVGTDTFAVIASDGTYSSEEGTVSISVSAATDTGSTTLQDDLIASALVWCDDGAQAGILDSTETSGTTGDTAGSYGVVPFTCTTSQIIAEGYYVDDTDYSRNVDVDGNTISAFTGSLSAPAGYTYVTPVSTMVNAIAGGSDATAEDIATAMAQVKSALGITGDDDLATLDINDSSNDTAAEAKKAALVVQQLVLDSTNALQGASGQSSITPASFKSVATQMAATIKATVEAGNSLISASGVVNSDVIESAVSEAIIAAAAADEDLFGSVNATAVAQVVKTAAATNAQATADAQDEYKAAVDSGDASAIATAKSNAVKATQKTQAGASKQIQLTLSAIKDYVKKGQTSNVGALVSAVASSLNSSVASQEEVDLSTTSTADVVSAIKTQVQESVMKLAVSSLSVEDLNDLGVSASDLQSTLETAVTTASEASLTVAKAVDDSGVKVNRAPEASDSEASVLSGQSSSTIPLIAFDPDGDALTYVIVSTTLGGITTSDISVTSSTGIATVSGEITSDGNIIFNVSDGTETTANATVTVTVGNATPFAYGQDVSVIAEGTVTGTLLGSDPEGVTLTYTIASQPNYGTVTLDGAAFTYVSSATTARPDSFTFTVSDGVNTSDAETVSITVLAPEGTNNAPVVDDLKVIVPTGTSSITRQISAADPDSDSMTFAIADASALCSGTTCTLTTSNGSSVSLTQSSGEFTLTPSGTFFGTDTFSVTATDAPTGTSMSALTSTPATVTVLIEAAAGTNNPPAVEDVAVSTSVNTAVSGNVVGSDLDFDTLTYDLVGGTCSASTGLCTLTTSEGNTVALTSASGAFAITPATDFTGIDTFTVTASDGTDTSDAATVTFTVSAAAGTNNVPTLTGTDLATESATAVSGAVYGEDLDYDTLTYSITDDGVTCAENTCTLTTSNESSVSLDQTTGSFTFTPSATFAGTDSFSVMVSDGTASSAAVTVSITVKAPEGTNNVPVVTGTEVIATSGTTVSGTVEGSDFDGDTLSYAIADSGADCATDAAVCTLTTSVGYTVSLTVATGAFTVTTPSSGISASDSFTVTASDGTASSSAATVTITFLNSSPVLTVAAFAVTEGSTATLSTTELSVVDADSSDTITFTLTTLPGDGTLSKSGTALSLNDTFTLTDVSGSTVTYQHGGGEESSDSFQVTVSDGTTTLDAATVTINVTAVNDAPTVSINTGFTVDEAGTATLTNTVLKAADVDSSSLTFTLSTVPSNGTLKNGDTALAASGTFSQDDIDNSKITYLHDGGETTSDSFQVTVSDGTASTDATTVAVTVTAVNDDPVVAVNTGVTLDGVTSTTITSAMLQITDAESAAAAITYTLSTAPTNGILYNNDTPLSVGGTFTQDDVDNNRITYTHDGGSSTSDTFQITASDGTATLGATSVAITITAATETFDATISGSVSAGPINNSTVSFGSASATSGDDGTYSFSVATPTEPVEFTFDVSSATDTVTDATPTFAPSSIVLPTDFTDSSASVNANTLTAIIAEAAKAAAGSASSISIADLSTATEGVLANFGFGTDAITGFDPRTTDIAGLSAENAILLSAGFEAATEMVRRVKTNVGGSTDEASILSALGSDLSDGTIDGTSKDGTSLDTSALVNAATLASAEVLSEVAAGTFTITGLADAAAAQAAMGSAFGKLITAADADTLATAVGNTSNFTGSGNAFAAKIKVALAAAHSIDSSLGYDTVSAALTSTDPEAAIKAVLTETGRDVSTAMNTVGNETADTARDKAQSAGEAANQFSNFLINTSSITLTDSSGTLTPETVADPSSGVLTVSLASTTTVSAANLDLLAAGDSSAVVPEVNFTLSSLPTGSGLASVTMMLVDVGVTNASGDAVRDSGERQLTAHFVVNWSSNGSTLTLSAPNTASFVGYTAAGSQVTGLLTNVVTGELLVTESGSNEGAQTTTLKARIASLFSASVLADTFSSAASAGNYYYSVTVNGIQLASTTGKSIREIKGTFTVE